MPSPTDRTPSAAYPSDHTGFGDCACDVCFPVEPLTPLAIPSRPFGLWRSLWVVLRGVRLYG